MFVTLQIPILKSDVDVPSSFPNFPVVCLCGGGGATWPAPKT